MTATALVWMEVISKSDPSDLDNSLRDRCPDSKIRILMVGTSSVMLAAWRVKV